ncbi:MAG: helix-turn-helix domain-containing protein [Bacteroidota bacterium]|nr:helix-turn-helix domain-containing protein [Bacteroidota bacterium]
MPQARLPFFPEEITLINQHIGFQKKNGIVWYFNGMMPVFQHQENDYLSFHLFTSQLVVNGNCKQSEIVKAFNISAISVKRWVKKFREQGSESFFIKKHSKKKIVLTPEKILEIQELSRQGFDIPEISSRSNIKVNTLQKAIRSGQILMPVPSPESQMVITKSDRNIQDSQTGMGKSCTNELERVLASKTGINCPINFSTQIDLSKAGVLLSLPALLSNGLLYGSDSFNYKTGYYSVESVFISLAFLSLLRIKTLAQCGSISTGELGRALGLDRIPEVKTLRKRIAAFSDTGKVEPWALELSGMWMANQPELSGIAYIDGHVNIYYGHQTQMPKRYVSRLRLCMSGSTDYYVNDAIGQPFFVVSKEVNSSMIETITNEIIPQLDKDIPNQPDAARLESNPLICKYMLVFDRECSSTEFFDQQWQARRAICTYKKNVKDKWDDAEFTEYEDVAPGGVTTKAMLAERGVLLEYQKKDTETGKSEKKKLWVREIRKKSESGHQTAIITTNFMLSMILIGLYMFARWSQENFFKYMIENFGIDTLVSYLKTEVNDTTQLINPQYREIESEQKKLTSKLNVRKTKFASLIIDNETIEENRMKKFLLKKADLKEEMTILEKEIESVKEKKAMISRKITYAELPEKDKFTNAVNQRKHFLDTIKMIAYRAETAMANMIKKDMSNPDQVRMLLKKIYGSDANIKPDYEKKVLTVELHRLNTWKEDIIKQKLCDELNLTETIFPNTNLTIFYKLVSIQNP